MKRVTDDMRTAIVAAVRRCNAFGLWPDVIDVHCRLPFAIGHATLLRALLGLVAAGVLTSRRVGGRQQWEFWVSASPPPAGSVAPLVEADADEEGQEGEEDDEQDDGFGFGGHGDLQP